MKTELWNSWWWIMVLAAAFSDSCLRGLAALCAGSIERFWCLWLRWLPRKSWIGCSSSTFASSAFWARSVRFAYWNFFIYGKARPFSDSWRLPDFLSCSSLLSFSETEAYSQLDKEFWLLLSSRSSTSSPAAFLSSFFSSSRELLNFIDYYSWTCS